MNSIFAISASGVVTTLVTVSDAEHIRFISSNPCNFGSSGGTFFDAIYPTSIIKCPQSDFAGLGGSALVTQEFSDGIFLLTSTGTGLPTFTRVNPGHDTGPVGQQEGSAIVDCIVSGPFGAPSPIIPEYPLGLLLLLAGVFVLYPIIRRRVDVPGYDSRLKNVRSQYNN